MTTYLYCGKNLIHISKLFLFFCVCVCFFCLFVLFCFVLEYVGVVSGEELFLFRFSPLIDHMKQMITSTSHSETESRSVLLDSLRSHGLYHGILQARILEPFPSTGHLPNPGMELRSPALQADSLSAEPPGNFLNTLIN